VRHWTVLSFCEKELNKDRHVKRKVDFFVVCRNSIKLIPKSQPVATSDIVAIENMEMERFFCEFMFGVSEIGTDREKSIFVKNDKERKCDSSSSLRARTTSHHNQ
jgi:hypothetical protein